ncbi:Abi family protein [Saccharopolyspora gloriosae]|uniref:Abi-like protein n=1 Tax=Saccharopolyspora gloriosae TaxID=455344 RepID=A0A840NRF3_9PSEU|nr:hypothetical protein [Saccharopolyspora gloriosae]MBB5072593.1 hypothetical protein [Saccharopolyspora gloriosae]
MSGDQPAWIHSTLSAARFQRYLTAANGEHADALRLYRWNLDVSAAFYAPLHWLEIGLRNGVHERLREHFGSGQWWELVQLTGYGRRAVTKEHAKLKRQKQAGFTADDVVAKLSLGFWVSLTSKGRGYDRTLWVPALHGAFPRFRGPRRDLHERLSGLLELRNRIMHHEPIFHLDLPARRAEIYRVLDHLSPTLPEQAGRYDRVPMLWEQRPRDLCPR